MRARLFVFALAACAALNASAASRFGGIVEGFGALKPGAATTVTDMTFSIGHAKFNMKNGVAVPVKANDQTVGMFFKGDSTLEYDDADPIEQPVLQHNIKGYNVKLTPTGNTSKLSANFNEVMLYAAGVPLPSLNGGAGADVANDLREHIDEFGADRSTPVVHQFLVASLGPASSKFVRAEMRVGREDLVYVYDAAGTMNESLYELRRPNTEVTEMRRRLFPVSLSQMPIGRDRKAVPPYPVTVTAVDYTLVADGENAKLNVTETLTRRSEDIKAINLDLFDEWYYKAGSAPRHEHVLGITDSKGQSLPFSHKQDELVVGLEGVPGTTFQLNYSIEGDFLIRPENDNFWQLGVAPWFPQPFFGGQYYTVHSVVKIRKPWIAIAPGTTVKRGEEGDFNVVENRIDKPVQFAVVHAGKYDVTEETRSGLTIRVASYGGKNERAAKQLTNLAYQIIDVYQYFLGPFPFDEFNIIQVNTFGYGQAPPGTMFITNEAFNSIMGETNQFFSQGINERFAHEIAHQYWAHVIKMPSAEEQWLTESFAEYSAALVIKKMKGDSAYNRLVSFWKDRAKIAAPSAPIPLANRLAGGDAFRDRTYLLYFKGPYLLYKLHQQLGDSPFLTFMKSYQTNFKFKFSNTNDAVAVLNFVTKQDFRPFFDQYFWGTAMPD